MNHHVNLNVDIPRVLGRQVRRYRLISGETQEDISVRCDIYRTYLSRIECGTANPSLNVLVSLATALGVHIEDLLLESEGNVDLY